MDLHQNLTKNKAEKVVAVMKFLEITPSQSLWYNFLIFKEERRRLGPNARARGPRTRSARGRVSQK